ncbi:MAG TPA: hypothetical protein VHZ64_07585 [Xanthobacteraceae bacterium]|nr:hypothetical protein [Xanthobacteraceae bacterium]
MSETTGGYEHDHEKLGFRLSITAADPPRAHQPMATPKATMMPAPAATVEIIRTVDFQFSYRVSRNLPSISSSTSRILKDCSSSVNSSLAVNLFSLASFADNDDLCVGNQKPTLTVMQGLPLGGSRGNPIPYGVALYSPALKIRTAARLCHRQTGQAVSAEVLRRSLFR